jgi:hypothetical protein
MFSTSHDILLLTISVCVAAITIFLCWGMFYIVAGIRNLFKVTNDVKNILKKTEETIDVIKQKVHESTTYLVLLGEVLKKIMDVAHNFGERRREAKEEREAEEDDCEDCEPSEKKKSRKAKIEVE